VRCANFLPTVVWLLACGAGIASLGAFAGDVETRDLRIDRTTPQKSGGAKALKGQDEAAAAEAKQSSGASAGGDAKDHGIAAESPAYSAAMNPIRKLGGRSLALSSTTSWASKANSNHGITAREGSSYRIRKDNLQILDRKTGKVAGEWPVVEKMGDPPTASPDGKYLACGGFFAGYRSILGVLDVERNRLLCVGDDHFGSPQWSPDGSQLAFKVRWDGKSEIWTLSTQALARLPVFAPACACPTVPEAAASLIGPWHIPQGNLVPLDLSRQANWDYKVPITETADNDIRTLSPGERVLAGVRFRTGDRLIQLQGKHLQKVPISADGIPVHLRAVRLYILHATHHGYAPYGVSDGERIAEYRVRYADGDAATIPVVVGQDVRDWWSTTSQAPVSRGQVAWAGTNKAINQSHGYLRLYLSTWENPQPEKTLASIDFVSLGTGAAPFCAAITAEEPRTSSPTKGNR
jgi:hypothetical protein